MSSSDDGLRYGANVVDFNRMAESAQQRFVRCTRGKGTPRPLLDDADQVSGSLVGWVLLAVVALAVMFGVALVGLGGLTPGRPPQPTMYWAIYAALLGIVVFALLAALRVRLVRGSLPFSPGLYLFPTDLVDARSAHLRLRPLAELTGVAVQGGAASGKRELILTFLAEDASSANKADGGYRIAFSEGAGRKTEQVAVPIHGKWDAADEIEGMIRGVKRAIEARDLGTLEPLDPFFEERVGRGWPALRPDPVMPSTPPRSARWWRPLMPIAAILIAVPGGYLAWQSRNDASDRRGLAAAAARLDQNLIEEYISRGGRLAAEADSARFEAAKKGSSKAILYYLQNGGLRVDDADDALFAMARADGGMAALSEYMGVGKRHLDEADDALLEAAKRGGAPLDFERYLTAGKRHEAAVRTTLLPGALLALAKRDDKLAPLRKWMLDHPGSPLEQDARAAIKQRFEWARERYRAKVNKRTPATEQVERLLTHIEAHDHPIVVQYRQVSSKDLRDEESRFVTDCRECVRATPFFDVPQNPWREGEAVVAMRDALQGLFDKDLVRVIADGGSERVAEGSGGPPTLMIRCVYSPEGSRTFRIGVKRYLSVEASCRVRLEIPGEKSSPDFSVSFTPGDRMLYRHEGANQAENVYDGMVRPLFEKMGARIAQWLRGGR